MRHIVIVGNSAAGIGCAEALREKDRSSRITIISEEPFSAYERPKVLGVIDGRLKERQLLWKAPDFYKNLDIGLMLETKAIGVSPHRKRVSLKDKEPVEFDELVVACGRKEKLPATKGINKEGVVGLNGLADVKFIQENLPLAHTVLVCGQGKTAQETARLIADRKIEVRFFGSFDAAAGTENVEVITDNPIIEILGEADVRAVRLSNQKVLGATMIIFSGTPSASVDFLADCNIEQDGGILVDENMRSSAPFIWAAGDACKPRQGQKTYGWDSAYAEGRRLGENLAKISSE